VKNAVKKTKEDVSSASIYSPDIFNRIFPIIKIGIYPVLYDDTIINYEKIYNNDHIQIIDVEAVKEHFKTVPNDVLTERTFFSESFPPSSEHTYELLLHVIADTFYYRFSYRPSHLFNVDMTMFIFPGGFISEKWGKCGDWMKYQHIYNRWIKMNWSAYPLHCNVEVKSVIEKAIETYYPTIKHKELLKLISKELTKLNIENKIITGDKVSPKIRIVYHWILAKNSIYDIQAIIKERKNDYTFVIYGLTIPVKNASRLPSPDDVVPFVPTEDFKPKTLPINSQVLPIVKMIPSFPLLPTLKIVPSIYPILPTVKMISKKNISLPNVENTPHVRKIEILHTPTPLRSFNLPPTQRIIFR